MLFLLFFIILLFETLITEGQGQNDDITTEEIIRTYQRPERLNYPCNEFISGNNLIKPSSVWGCDKYSAAVFVLTKRAIRFAKEVTTYLQSNNTDSEELSKISTPLAVSKLKINVLHKGVDLYRDLVLIVGVLRRDSMNAISKCLEINYRMNWSIKFLSSHQLRSDHQLN